MHNDINIKRCFHFLLSHEGSYIGNIERLGNDPRNAVLGCSFQYIAIGITGYDDYRDFAVDDPDVLQYLGDVHVGQSEIQEYLVELDRLQQFERIGAVCGYHDYMPFILQNLFYHVAYGGGVIDNQDMLHVLGQAVQHAVNLGTIETQIAAYFGGRKRALFYQLVYGFLAYVKIFSDFFGRHYIIHITPRSWYTI
jgi:hypothetical protein